MNIETASSSSVPPSTMPPPMPRRRKKPHWLLWTVLTCSLLVNWVTCSDLGNAFSDVGLNEIPNVEQTLMWGSGKAPAHIALLKLEGVIMREGASTFFGEAVDPVTKLLTEIRSVTLDPDMRAILLEVDSPGGGVTASDEIYQALMEFKASDPDRKVVVHIRDMAASGGYYVALAGDLLVAQPTSVVGSIGVIISALNMHQLGEKIGIQDVSLTSSDNKALLSSLSPVNPEHSEILQKVVDDMYQRFRGLVLKHRPFTAEFADKHQLLDGRIFSQSEALAFGLVDETGYIDYTRGRVLALLGVEEAGFYQVDYAEEGWGSLFSMKTPEILAPVSSHAKFQYLWKP